MKIPSRSPQSVFADLPSRAHVRVAPIVVSAKIHARRRDGSVFVWQQNAPIVKQGRKWFWYSKRGHVYIALSRKQDKRFFLADHAQE